MCVCVRVYKEMNNTFVFLLFLYSRSLSFFMAACIVENTRLSSYQITNSIHFHVQSNQMESTKKRRLRRTNTFTSNNELTKTITDNSCSVQAVTITTDSNNKCMKNILE
jgi:hypothetical protein